MNTRHINTFIALMGILMLTGCQSVGQAQRATCRNHLLQINEPLNCCIPQEQRLKPGTAIPESEVLQYLKGGALPRCPSGAEYRIAYVAGGRPVCPVHGDLLAGVTNAKVFGDRPIYPPAQ